MKMKKSAKQILCLLLAIVLTGSSAGTALAVQTDGTGADAQEVSVSAFADDSGTIGSVTWAFDADTGTLTISGSGDMPSYTYENRTTIPWYEYRSEIKSVVIEEGITSVGAYAFAYYYIESVDIADSVTVIEEEAFYWCFNLNDLNLGSGLVEIGTYAFNCCTGLTGVKFGENLQRIGYRAFNQCYSLESISFPDSLNSLDNMAFEDCEALTEVVIPANVQDIGMGVFNGCILLDEITVSDENSYFTTVEGVLFSADLSELLQYPSGKTDTSYTVPDAVITIGGYSFRGNDYLEDVIIGENVTHIEEGAFCFCLGLKNVLLGSAFSTYGYYSQSIFAGCSNLESLKFKGNAVYYDKGYDSSFTLALLFGYDTGSLSESGLTIYYPAEDTSWTEEYLAEAGKYIYYDDETVSVDYSYEPWDTPTVVKTAIADCTISLSQSSYTYDGSEKMPAVTVKNGSATLIEGINYTVSYSDNADAGTATVTITGLGIYTGTATETFTINKSEQSIEASLSSTSVKVGSSVSVTASGIGTLTYTSADTSIATVTGSGKVTGVSSGTVKITVTAAGNSNYNSASKTLTLKVEGTTSSVGLSTLTYSYTNSYNSLGYSTSYRIPLARYKMFYSSTLAKTYYAIDGLWGGSCFGFSATSGMFNVSGSTLALSDFSSSALTVSSLLLTDENDDIDLNVLELLEAMQVSQRVDDIQDSLDDYENDLDAIAGLAANVANGGCPPIITVRTSSAGHAVVGYALEKISSTKTYLYVYDCNYPNTERYITLSTNSSGDYTGWSYGKYTYEISCVPYTVYQSAWAGRLTNLSSSVNTLFTGSESFEIQDADGTVLASMTDGTFTSSSEEIYLCKTADTETDGSIVYLPTDIYTIVDTSGSDDFELTMVNVDQSAEIVTEADTVEVLVDDTQLASVVTIDADSSESYEVTVTSDQEGTPTDTETLTFKGKCSDGAATVGISDGQPVEEGYSSDSVSVDDSLITLIGSEDMELTGIKLDASSASCDADRPAVTSVTGNYGSEALIEGVDYTVVYSGYDSSGTATVTAFGLGEFTGSVSATYTVTECSAHSYDDGVVTKEPTIATTGERVYTCIYCGSTYTEEIAQLESTQESTQNSDSTQSGGGSVSLKKQKITVKKAQLKKTIHTKKLKKKAQTFKLKASTSGNGKITYKKVSGNKKIKVSKTGKVTVKKGLKKGKTYKLKVKITAAKTSNYKKASVTKTIKIKIK